MVAPIGPEFDSVLAWHLGNGLTGSHLDAVSSLASQLRAADLRGKRPILCAPDTDLRSYSRQVDLLQLGRSPLGTSLELSDYGTWLRQRHRAGLPLWPGTPFLGHPCKPQLSPSTSRAQLEFSSRFLHFIPASAAAEAVRLLTYTTIGSGAHGLEFQSDVPLVQMPPDMRRTLALLNLELELIEPWAATGAVSEPAMSLDPQLLGLVLQTDKARLLMAMRLAPGSQYVPQPAAAGPAVFVVPGVPESYEFYELSPTGLRKLNHKRVTRGIQVTLDDFQLSSLVLITPDPVVVTTLDRRLAAMSMQAVDLQREVTSQTLAQYEAIDRQLPRRAKEAPAVAEWLAKAQAEFADADRLLAAGDRRAAFMASRQALGPLKQLERHRWEQATALQTSLAASPFIAAFDTLPAQWRFADELHASHAGPNRLPGGDCESVPAMMQAGWRHTEHPLAGVRSTVEQSTTQAHGGRFSLRLQVAPATPGDAASLVETPPVWITTPPLPARRGELLAIRAFVRVPKPITGSVDGLLVFDSIGGEPLAERIGKTDGWKQLVLYRVAPQDGPVTVTFALTGIGDAWIDDVTVEPMSR